MSNDGPQVGYVVKQAQSLLRLRMEEALAPLDLSVSHYSCLHHLRREPGISAAALARGIFITRQSMSAMLQQLLDRGLVERAAHAQGGRALPTALTPLGVATLDAAQGLVDDVEGRMLSGLDRAERDALARALQSCVASLT
jgi:DNA-binding MarR family transcriptional regulator